MNKNIKDVIVYATLSCPYCKMEDTWLDKQGIDHKLVFVDLSPKDAQAMVKKTGQMGVPVTEITYQDMSSEYVVGFDQQKLTQILGV